MSDLFSERDRASAMAVYTLGPLIGPGAYSYHLLALSNLYAHRGFRSHWPHRWR
jgi:hypothetical protein